MATIVPFNVIKVTRISTFRNTSCRRITCRHRSHNQYNKNRTWEARFFQHANQRTSHHFNYRQTIKITNSGSGLRLQCRATYRLRRFRRFTYLTKIKSRRRSVILTSSTRITILYFTKVRRMNEHTNQARNNHSIRNSLSYFSRATNSRVPSRFICVFRGRYRDLFVTINCQGVTCYFDFLLRGK